jgi:hypothetical protein
MWVHGLQVTHFFCEKHQIVCRTKIAKGKILLVLTTAQQSGIPQVEMAGEN